MLSLSDLPDLKANGEQIGSTSFSFRLTHKCCCPNACQAAGGLSGGSILLIIFFCLAFSYLVLGAVFLKYKRGATGKEVIPNATFWSGIPGLVKDGFLFVISPCSKRGSYNQV